MKKGNLYVIATPIGNLDDISFRAINTLKTVDLILAEDTRHSKILLNHFSITTPMQSYHKFNEKEKSENIIEKILEGYNIALISDAGTPGICDPGNILIRYCINNDVNIVPIPGSCAFLQSLICSGFDTSNFSFFGFLPVSNRERKQSLNMLSSCTSSIIILYEAPHKLLNTLQDLYKQFGNCNICISKEITKLHENHFRTTLSNAVEYYSNTTPKGEFVLIIQKPQVPEYKHSIDNIDTQKIISDKYLLQRNDLSLKEISKSLSQELNISKNEIYDFLLTIKNTMD